MLRYCSVPFGLAFRLEDEASEGDEQAVREAIAELRGTARVVYEQSELPSELRTRFALPLSIQGMTIWVGPDADIEDLMKGYQAARGSKDIWVIGTPPAEQ